MRTARARFGFTLVEMLFVMFIAFGTGLLLPGLGASRKNARINACGLNVRSDVQAFIIWSSANNDEYPLPSALDTKNATVKEIGRAKDISANIFSILIFNGSITPKLLVCTAESNKSIGICANYEYSNPAKAVDPKSALWDPKFSGDFVNSTGNMSFAHIQPSGVPGQPADPKNKTPETKTFGRLNRWMATIDASQAVLGDRGPEVTGVTMDKAASRASLKITTKLETSKSLLNHGTTKGWRGQIGYNDNHVQFTNTLAPETDTYTAQNRVVKPDVLFYDEPDSVEENNNFLGIFTKAGAKPAEYKAIWD